MIFAVLERRLIQLLTRKLSYCRNDDAPYIEWSKKVMPQFYEQRKNGGQTPNKKFPNKRWSVVSMNRLTKNIDICGSTERTSAVAVRGL